MILVEEDHFEAMIGILSPPIQEDPLQAATDYLLRCPEIRIEASQLIEEYCWTRTDLLRRPSHVRMKASPNIERPRAIATVIIRCWSVRILAPIAGVSCLSQYLL